MFITGCLCRTPLGHPFASRPGHRLSMFLRGHSMHTFWQGLRYAARTLRNSPGFTIIAIVTLGLGMAVNATVFSVINGLLLRPLPVPHAEQMAVLAMQQTGTPGFQR